VPAAFQQPSGSAPARHVVGALPLAVLLDFFGRLRENVKTPGWLPGVFLFILFL
jgi:hypothetical protein